MLVSRSWFPIFTFKPKEIVVPITLLCTLSLSPINCFYCIQKSMFKKQFKVLLKTLKAPWLWETFWNKRFLRLQSEPQISSINWSKLNANHFFHNQIKLNSQFLVIGMYGWYQVKLTCLQMNITYAFYEKKYPNPTDFCGKIK